jgi:hypothetical protein
MRSLSVGPQGTQLDQPQPEQAKNESLKQDPPKQETPKLDLSSTLPQGTLPQGTLPQGTLPQGALSQSTLPQDTRGLDLQREPGVKRPISDHPEHPVNTKDTSVYFSRTGNLAGLSIDQQAEKLANAMKSLGPGKVLLLETSGPAGGSYVEELRRALPKALEMVPEGQRPEIRLFVSDGRPVLPAGWNKERGPNDLPPVADNEFANFLMALDEKKKGSGIVATDPLKDGRERAVPNWANPEVADYFLKQRIDPAIALAKELGLKSVVMDDHIGIPPDNPKGKPPTYMMSDFKAANGNLSDGQVQNIITGIYKQGLQKINAAELDAGMSSASDVAGSLRFGIKLNELAKFSDTIELQGYRPVTSEVAGMTSNLLQNIRSSLDQNKDEYKGVREIKIALATEARGIKLDEKKLIEQQDVIDVFRSQINAEYNKRGLEPPKVSTSLWAHQHFYKDE